jgi:16S rRNA (guanine527-N7)-methyltransferase
VERFAALLASRAVDLGLIAEGDRERVLERHVLDSGRAVRHIRAGERVADLGSGAGLPGIPLAMAVPDASFVLIEPRQKAVAFLELALERLGITNADVFEGRVEEADLRVDVATARAFGPLSRSWHAARLVLRPGGRLIYFAGASFDRSDAGSLPGASRVEFDSSPPLVIVTRED